MSIILDNKAKIKIGLGVFIVGLTALTLNYLLKNIRKLVFLTFDYKSVDLVKVNLKEISFTLNWTFASFAKLAPQPCLNPDITCCDAIEPPVFKELCFICDLYIFNHIYFFRD